MNVDQHLKHLPVNNVILMENVQCVLKVILWIRIKTVSSVNIMINNHQIGLI